MVTRVEKIESGRIGHFAEPDTKGNYHCYPEGQNMAKYRILFGTLDEVAKFLIRHKRGKVRMNPGWSLIVDKIHIDGAPREHL